MGQNPGSERPRFWEGFSLIFSYARNTWGLAAQRLRSGGKSEKALKSALNSAIRRTRLLARGLSPVRASTEGLKEGFEELVNNVHEVYGLRVRLRMELPEELSVDENPVMNLFHIAQEAVENAARHAGVSDIRLTFRVTGPDLELQVEDDGVGFDPLQVAGGTGLRMMRFRADMARGFLSIDSRPGFGARLRCRCPAKTERVP